MRLSEVQKLSLSNYCGNLSIAWFAAGIIGPLVSQQDLNSIAWIVYVSGLISGFLLVVMLILCRKDRR